MSAHGGKLRALPASDGKPVNHDSSATAEEAAPHVARASTPGAPASAALPPPLTAAEALVQAQAEGLTLGRSSFRQSGFLNVGMTKQGETLQGRRVARRQARPPRLLRHFQVVFIPIRLRNQN